MRIEILYENHIYEEYDSLTATNSEPYKNQGTNILTDWILDLSNPEQNGITLTQNWYDNQLTPEEAQNQPTNQPIPAARKTGTILLLIAPNEIQKIIWLKKDGEKLLWKEGQDLINGERFYMMEQLCYSDASIQSINRRALAVYDYLTNANPNLTPEQTAQLMGYTHQAIERIQNAELAQNDHYTIDETPEND